SSISATFGSANAPLAPRFEPAESRPRNQNSLGIFTGLEHNGQLHAGESRSPETLAEAKGDCAFAHNSRARPASVRLRRRCGNRRGCGRRHHDMVFWARPAELT